MTEQDPRPGTFAIAGGDTEQPHLRLTGANGEVVVWSENYTDPRTAHSALEVIVRTVLVAANTVLSDLEHTDEVPDLVERVTAELLKDGS